MSGVDPKLFLVIAGEASGDLLAAELVAALRVDPVVRGWPFAPRFCGAGGPRMAAAGVELAFDLTRHAVVGFTDVLRGLRQFHRLLNALVDLACVRQPDVVVCVDFSGFNRRWVRALRKRLDRPASWFRNWRPRIVQYVSPQVWASRPGRARGLARDLDLLLCLFSFEKEWYAARVPELRVEWVGHPLLDRHGIMDGVSDAGWSGAEGKRRVVVLPGSRDGELRRHMPVLMAALRRLGSEHALAVRLVAPDEARARLARALGAGELPFVKVEVGGVGEALRVAELALASTGTVTLECACYGVPTVALYRTSWGTYHVGRHLVNVPFLSMPNLLAGEELFPEFIQGQATPANLARAAGAWLSDPERCRVLREKLRGVVASLGGPGASARAAGAIARMIDAEGLR
ncbi:MAG TPA: lipid-A-disaccharide synthase [Verrucomicrobiota bacterium]|nr:lipid-A-disaccharide synthase [Verrucomicrobiota bacterium]HNU50406.1 lipid-A-disaccharide synthase [Verrucomicrobiota bacterium]